MNRSSQILLLLLLFTIFNNSYGQQYGANQYKIYGFHQDWHTFVSSTVVGASTTNSDTTGVLVICENTKNNCMLRFDINGQCLWNGNQKVRVSVDGKFLGVSNFVCSGRPYGAGISLNLSMLISSLSRNIDLAMKRGATINFDLYDSTNTQVGVRASLIGYTAARKEMKVLRAQLRK